MPKLKWIVLEENPTPDNYIAIIVADERRNLKAQLKSCSVFYDENGAVGRARQLCSMHKVKSIRIFHVEGHSEILNRKIRSIQ